MIATVHHTSVDYYHCAITANTSLAILPQLAFEGATRKTRPVLQPGALVYARVAHADKFMDAELDCVHPSSGKADGLGPLKGGMLFDISLTMARRLMSHKAHEQGNLVVLQEIAERLPFEIAVGGNGKLWVQSEKGAATLAIGRAIVQIDQEGIGVEAQKSFARKMLDRL